MAMISARSCLTGLFGTGSGEFPKAFADSICLRLLARIRSGIQASTESADGFITCHEWLG